MINWLMRRLRREDGVAMVVVMGSLLVVSLSAAALAAGASQTNDSAVDDENSKRALAAAEAGLQVATQRYDTFRRQLLATECLAGTGGVTRQNMGATATAATTECPAVTGGADVGDGATYSYVISLPGAPCRSAPNAVTRVSANDRCITSTGTVGDARRRVQTRLGWVAGRPFFDTAGLVGLDSLTFINSNDVNSGIGSNGAITIGNSVRIIGDASYGPEGSITFNGTSGRIVGSQIPRTEPFELDLSEDFDRAAATNDNNALPNSWFEGGTRTTRMFKPPNGTDATMPVPAGTDTVTYYFCNVYLDNSVRLLLPPNREVKIYIDSPTRGGTSTCATGGRMHLRNSIDWNWPSGPGLASNLEFYIAGTGGEDLYLENSVRISALFYAPNSTVDINNSIHVNGAIAAKSILVNNSINFTWPDDARTDPGPGRRTTWSGWFECSPRPSVAGDAESGC